MREKQPFTDRSVFAECLILTQPRCFEESLFHPPADCHEGSLKKKWVQNCAAYLINLGEVQYASSLTLKIKQFRGESAPAARFLLKTKCLWKKVSAFHLIRDKKSKAWRKTFNVFKWYGMTFKGRSCSSKRLNKVCKSMKQVRNSTKKKKYHKVAARLSVSFLNVI